jgi:hypothetical protein
MISMMKEANSAKTAVEEFQKPENEDDEKKRRNEERKES